MPKTVLQSKGHVKNVKVKKSHSKMRKKTPVILLILSNSFFVLLLLVNLRLNSKTIKLKNIHQMFKIYKTQLRH